MDIARLRSLKDQARLLMDEALRQEHEAAERCAEDPKTFENWHLAKAITKHAISDFETAQTAYLEAQNKS